MYINEHVINKMQDTLKLAGDATRLKILFCLLDELDTSSSDPHHLIEKCVNDIALQIGCSQSLVSHQLKDLKDEHVKQIMQITYEHVLEGEHHD